MENMTMGGAVAGLEAGTAADGTGLPGVAPGTDRRWRRLVEGRVLFGHQSVGADVLEGLAELARRDGVALHIALAEGARAEAPGLYHARVGENGAPGTKLAAFAKLVDGAPAGTVALVKFCYVDVTATTDAVALFAEYRATIDGLRERNEGVRFVHVTMPLRVDPGALAHWSAVVRLLVPHRRLNAIRARYNDLLRAEYAGREPVYDLAALESTDAKGSQVAAGYAGARVPSLAAEWTRDGGHLNEAGRRRAAEGLLATLASL